MGIKFDTVIFDLDGTLLDTLEDLTDSVNYTMKLYGYPERTIAEIKSFVGNGIGRLIRLSVPKEVGNVMYEKVLASFKKYYTDNCRHKTRPYDGIHDLIQKLNEIGIKTAIVSNKNDAAVKELNKYYFNNMFKVAIGDRPDFNRKPAPDSVYTALKELESKKESSIYVGDSDVDIETAKNADMYNVLVTWGFRDKAFLMEKGGTHFIDKPLELLDYISGKNN